MTGLPMVQNSIIGSGMNALDLLNAQPGGIIRMQSPNEMAAYQQQVQLSQLAQMQQAPQQNYLAQALLSAAPVSKPTGDWERGRAKSYADEGEKLIGRIAFWAVFAALPIAGWFADLVVVRLAAKLEQTTEEIERWMQMASAYGTNS